MEAREEFVELCVLGSIALVFNFFQWSLLLFSNTYCRSQFSSSRFYFMLQKRKSRRTSKFGFQNRREGCL